MVEVTKFNFEEVLTKVKVDLKKCAYYAVDCEFTYIPLENEIEHSFFDSGNDRYCKIKDKLKNSAVIQVGLAPFIFSRDLNEYRCTIYKFFICPKGFGPFDEELIYKSSSLEFLCDNSFDFNKCYYDGIPCLNKNQIEKIKKEHKSGRLIDSLIDQLQYEDFESIKKSSTTVEEWLKKSETGDTVIISGKHFNLNYNFILQQEIRKRFPNTWTTKSQDHIIVKHVTKEERTKLEKSSNLIEETLDSLRGFSKVYQMMIESKKPFIGHNLYFDLLMMYSKFHEDLPSSFSSFKREINHLFPVVYDNKFLSFEYKRMTKKDYVENTALGTLYDYYKDKNTILDGPRIMFNQGIYDKPEDQFLHDAGWDAYVTGFCFIKLVHAIAQLKAKSADPLRFLTSIEHFRAVESLQNRINISRARVSHLRLDGPDPISTRPPVLYLNSKSKRIDFYELTEFLRKYDTVHKKSLSSHEALLAASNYFSFKNVLRDLIGHKDYQVQKYSTLKHNRLIHSLLVAGVLLPAGLCLWAGYAKFK